jgi:hypothetical protein
MTAARRAVWVLLLASLQVPPSLWPAGQNLITSDALCSVGSRMESTGNGSRPRLGWAILFAGIIAIGLLVTLASVQPSASVPGPSTAHPTLFRSGEPRSAAGSGPLLNATPCGVFASEYGNDTSIEYYANFSYMFSQLCQTPRFVSIYEGMGPNGSFVIGWGGQVGAVPDLFFSLYWITNCTNTSYGPVTTQCVNQADWEGYLSNNTVTGPVVREYPAVSTGPIPVMGPPTPVSNPWVILAAVGAVAAVMGILVVVVVRRGGLPPNPPNPDRSPTEATDGHE